MSHIRDAELALVRAVQCGTNGAFCFLVSETDPTPIQSVKDAKDHLDNLILQQRIEQIKADVAAIEVKAVKEDKAAKTTEAEHALQAVAEKVAHFAMDIATEA